MAIGFITLIINLFYSDIQVIVVVQFVFFIGFMVGCFGLWGMNTENKENTVSYHNEMTAWVMEDSGIPLSSDLVDKLIDGQIVTVDTGDESFMLSFKETKGGHVKLMQTVQTEINTSK